jgi:hypothetical protein
MNKFFLIFSNAISSRNFRSGLLMASFSACLSTSDSRNNYRDFLLKRYDVESTALDLAYTSRLLIHPLRKMLL